MAQKDKLKNDACWFLHAYTHASYSITFKNKNFKINVIILLSTSELQHVMQWYRTGNKYIVSKFLRKNSSCSNPLNRHKTTAIIFFKTIVTYNCRASKPVFMWMLHFPFNFAKIVNATVAHPVLHTLTL